MTTVVQARTIRRRETPRHLLSKAGTTPSPEGNTLRRVRFGL